MRPPLPIGRVEGRAVVGIGLMLAAIGLFTCLNGMVKWLTISFDPLQVVWARYAGAVVFMLVAFMPRHGIRLLRPNRPRAQLLRGILLLGSSVFYFFGLSYLDMASGAAIQLTGPLIVTALSVPLLKEHVGWRRWMAVGFGFIGALIVIRPGVDMRWASLLFVASACCSALYQIYTRYLSRHDDAAVAATVAAAVGLIALTPIAPFVWITPDAWLPIVLFVILGILAGMGHFLLTNAYRFAGASTLAPFSYAHLLGAVVIGYAVFGDFPDLWTWVGAGVIVSAGLYVAQRERIMHQAVPQPKKKP